METGSALFCLAGCFSFPPSNCRDLLGGRVKREKNKQDATNLVFIIKRLSQHVSGIIMLIFRRTRLCVNAYGVLHWLCWLWLCAVVLRAVCTQFAAQPLQNTICSYTKSCSPEDGHNDARNMLDRTLIINTRLAASCWFFSHFTLRS